jgi:AcrR family transcriptional regulator
MVDMNRMSAQERREQLLAIASDAFAESGLHGTTAETIARRAGISQAYIFRLFGTKKELFRLAVNECFERMTKALESAAEGASGEDALMLMGDRYRTLLLDRTFLLLQLQGFAACADLEVRDTVREGFGRLWNTVTSVTGLEPLKVKMFIAFGMLLNDVAAMDIEHLDEAWAHAAATAVPVELYQQRL